MDLAHCLVRSGGWMVGTPPPHASGLRTLNVMFPDPEPDISNLLGYNYGCYVGSVSTFYAERTNIIVTGLALVIAREPELSRILVKDPARRNLFNTLEAVLPSAYQMLRAPNRVLSTIRLHATAHLQGS